MSAQIINFRPEGDQEWARWAECAKPGRPDMFPTDGDVKAVAAAKSTCHACPVVAECLEEALKRGESYGVWGGYIGSDLTVLRRNAARRSRKTGEPRASASELADAAALDLASESVAS